ncbi:Conserved oligomeric Golgi complex subunit 5 [Armadillidium nasatum]|uniref:Conserved oligomeric Golgi complex subunit 5 n=1 Tax=Armadillidium nasatum TaxID=96803 RepID=A0A5N5TGI8_9CRUS|nr:Conserved oligomeric Golgi complex subunit 5 [Armadillidium nasatum]
MHERIQTLQAGVERLRARVVEPYNQISQQTLILGRLQSACELLRRIIRCLSLSQRLQEQMANGPKDITKAALSLRELDDISKSMDLSGITILEKDQRMIRQARSDIEKQATLMLDKGMEMQNQSQVGTALQVFYNLGMLHSSVEKVLDNLIKHLNKSVTSALDVNYLTQLTQNTKKGGAPGKAVMPTIGQSAQFRANLWAGLEKLMDDIYHICMKTSHLHKVLAKKKDSNTHVCFLEEIYKQSTADLFTRVWKNVTLILSEEFARAANESNFIRQALEVDYPKLVRLYGDLWKKLEVISSDIRAAQTFGSDLSTSIQLNLEEAQDMERNNDSEAVEFDPETALRNSLIPIEKAYISRSLSRLFDAVNLMFSTPGTVPSKEEIDTLIKTITSELNISSIDKNLSETIGRNVVKTLQLFCQKCEQLVVADGEASQVIGPSTPGQILNVNIVNQLIYVYNQIERTANSTLAHLPRSVLQSMLKTLPSVEALISSTTQPLFSSLRDSVEAIILTMHKEDFSSNDSRASDSDIQVSLYMKELQGFLNRAATDYIEPFHQCSVITKKVYNLCSFALELFVRHASLLRPIGDQGKMRLGTADFAQMELAINPLVPRASDLGRPYRIIRAFRPLLFQTPEHIASSPSIGDVIPYSTILHYLFGRAPPELRSPHQTAGWSQTRYSNWLDDHPSERERLSLVEGALESYVSTVKSKHLTEFDPLYPIMKDLLEKGLVYVGKGTKVVAYAEIS